jgi:TRAP-type mannitol/chloroaromatic compound transport system permease small subunit
MKARAGLRRFAIALDRGLDRVGGGAAWLVLPLAVLLCAQWPLRDLVGAWSRQANDIAQWVFALYVAFAIREATRRHAHLAAGLPPREPIARWRRAVMRAGEALLVLPWAVFVVVSAGAPTWRSLLGLEAFPDTFNPLYFVIRCSAWLLALLVALQAMLDLASPPADTTARAAP